MTRVIRLHFKTIYSIFIPYCNYNVTTYPMKIVATYPKVVFFTRSTCQSNTNAHNAEIIPSIYSTGILHFPNLSMSRCSWITFGTR